MVKEIEEHIAEIAGRLDLEKDYHVTVEKQGNILTMRIEEKPGGNLPAEKGFVSREAVPTRDDVPADILKALEVDGSSLDDAVHDEKGGEAAGINNDGYWSQLEYLRGNGWDWNTIRKALGLKEELDEPPS